MRVSGIRQAITSSEEFVSGRYFRPQDIYNTSERPSRKSIWRAFNALHVDGELEKHPQKRGYYRRTPTVKSLQDLPELLPEIDSGRLTMREAAKQFPWHYETFRRYIRHARLGVGKFAKPCASTCGSSGRGLGNE